MFWKEDFLVSEQEDLRDLIQEIKEKGWRNFKRRYC